MINGNKNNILFYVVAFILISSAKNLFAQNQMTDNQVKTAVENELMLNSSTPSDLIHVETKDGIVTLSGTVDNLLAKDRALKIAGTVKGVRAVINEIDVDAPFVSDSLLEQEVIRALVDDPAADSYQLTVSAESGIITLHGTVDSWQEKRLSGFVAMGVEGVKKVNNDIHINLKSTRSDIEIEKEVEQVLHYDVRIDDALIKVNVAEGVVKLSGMVGSLNEQYTAVADSYVAGVHLVESGELEINKWARDKNMRENKYLPKTSADLKQAVEDAFLYDPRLKSFNPDVSVNEGIVTLNGEVDNLKAKRAAGQDAKNVVGVFGVKNQLDVRPMYIPQDNELKSKIISAIEKEPALENKGVEVKADHGLVYLSGDVGSGFQKSLAEEIVSKIKGVTDINNNIQVTGNSEKVYSDYYGWNNFYPPYHVKVSNSYKNDSEIKDNIESQLWWSPYVNQDDIDVSVSKGVVTLEGTVDTDREKLYAEINAIEGGAKEVKNNIIVNYTP